MKKLPISIQTFEKIRESESLYVDKTHFIFSMASKGTYYFLARPRRFGKSLLLSTFKAFFQGKKELFEGLYIYDKEQEWKEYPVIHIDYSFIEYQKGRAIFEESLLKHLQEIAASYEVSLDVEQKIIKNVFTQLIKSLHEKYGQVVVLIDEYDKAMVDTLTDTKRFYENREVLRGLYGALKGLDAYLRFVMLTGISRFSKVNVFSGMNNLHDISESEEFATIAGFTQQELEQYFDEWIDQLNRKTFQMPRKELMSHIKHWYNGFSFDGKNKLYNPFSILSLFANLDFSNYWFSTGTPTFLIDLIRAQKILPESFEDIRIADLSGGTDHIENLPLVPILYQTGYLTVNKVERKGVRKFYYLNYPNEEVRYSFLTYIIAGFIGKENANIRPELISLSYDLMDGKTDEFVKRLQSFFADIPARLHLPKEAYYHSMVYLILRLMGTKLNLEKETSQGRIDGVLELSDKVYIIEFKFATNKRIKNVETLAEKALKQIEEKKYYEPYLSEEKEIILFGMGFLDKKVSGKVKRFA